MKHARWRWTGWTLAALALTSPFGPSALADDEKAAPTAAQILDRFVEATGGEKAHRALTMRRVTGTLTVDQSGHGFTAKIERTMHAPGRSHLLIQSEHFFQVTATDGKQAWEWRPGHSHGEEEESNHTHLLAGEKRFRVIEQARFHAALDWREHLERCERVGRTSVKGRPADEVRLHPKGGAAYSNFYDCESGLLVKSVRTIEGSHDGPLTIESAIGDYREVDGVRLATSLHQVLKSEQGLPGTQIWKYDEIVHPEKLPASLFALPDELETTKEKTDGATRDDHSDS